MKITAIKVYPVWVGIRNQLLVKVETDEGIYGWGESGLSGREKAVAGALSTIASSWSAATPCASGALWQEMYRSQYFEGGRVLHRGHLGARHRALRHQGQGAGRAGLPVARRQAARPGADLRDHLGRAGPEMIEQGKLLMEHGWTGSASSRAGHEQQRPLRAARVDRRHRATGWQGARGAGRRRRAGHRLPPSPVGRRGRLVLPEDAVAARSTSWRSRSATRRRRPTSRCARMTDVPFAIGEEFASKWQFLPYIERGIHQFNRLDICNVGGFTEAMKVAGWSEAHYVDLMPHNPLGPICTAATVHMRRRWRTSPGSNAAPRRPRRWASTTASSSPCSRRSTGPTTSSPTRRDWASRSTRSCSQAGVQVLGSAASAPQGRLLHQLVNTCRIAREG